METRDLLSDAYAPCDGVVVNRLGDETVALDLANGTYYGFDRVGTMLWDKLTAGEQLSSVKRRMSEKLQIEKRMEE